VAKFFYDFMLAKDLGLQLLYSELSPVERVIINGRKRRRMEKLGKRKNSSAIVFVFHASGVSRDVVCACPNDPSLT
jgi:hypothetical protein